jgi:hypothetical protein
VLRLTLSLLAERAFLLATSSKDRTQGLPKLRCRSILGIECYKHHLSSRGAWLEKSMLSRRSEFRAFTCPVLRPLIMTSSWQSAFLGTSLFPAEFHKVSVDVPQPIQRTHLPALLWIAELVSGRFPNEGGRNIKRRLCFPRISSRSEPSGSLKRDHFLSPPIVRSMFRYASILATQCLLILWPNSCIWTREAIYILALKTFVPH